MIYSENLFALRKNIKHVAVRFNEQFRKNKNREKMIYEKNHMHSLSANETIRKNIPASGSVVDVH